jgi:hypothetical protein
VRLLPDADPEAERVFRSFVADGRITQLPAKWSKRQILLDHVARLFEPGQRYLEPEVNAILGEVFPEDVAALRRSLVDGGFLDRDAGEYWRTGGTVEI